MGKTTLAVLVTMAFSGIGVLGDYFLKLASTRDHPLRAGSFDLGFTLYASTAFGWVYLFVRRIRARKRRVAPCAYSAI